ncbi:MAG TPA: pirin family protein [Streptosporangiaceae bacterium]|nr:pirin family protein [Streptosporangiaceae bacterium]
MSNLDIQPAETVCGAGDSVPPPAAIAVLQPRQVPLGGPRAMNVRRTLPQRQRSLIGGWCFVDHYGPDPVAQTGGMSVPPHPHTGLQTVSWLFSGEIEHRDSAGNHVYVRPGELNLMTAGRGISHSEVSTPATCTLHGVQLWVALPAATRFTNPCFEHYVPDILTETGYTAAVFLGSLLGQSSPVATYSRLLGAELSITAGGRAELPADLAFEHGVLVDTGAVMVNGTPVGRAELAYVPPGTGTLEILATAGSGARVLLLGGEPLGEQIVMWWNFIGRSHAEIAEYRANWQAEIGPAQATPANGALVAQFGLPAGDPLPPIPAPPLPKNVTLRPRS